MRPMVENRRNRSSSSLNRQALRGPSEVPSSSFKLQFRAEESQHCGRAWQSAEEASAAPPIATVATRKETRRSRSNRNLAGPSMVNTLLRGKMFKPAVPSSVVEERSPAQRRIRVPKRGATESLRSRDSSKSVSDRAEEETTGRQLTAAKAVTLS